MSLTQNLYGGGTTWLSNIINKNEKTEDKKFD